MNFFEHQERARRTSTRLVVLFLLAVLAIALVVGLLVYLLCFGWRVPELTLGEWLRSPGFGWSMLATFAVIAAGTLHRTWQLRDGGEALAALLRAREIPPDTRMTDERVLRNVVEEMAIAAGLPAPRTFLLPREKAINAFVAGYRPTEAVVFVTQGALDELSRDELQGVVAHEFSHILNADMRINMRLMSLLAGILAIGKVGEFLVYTTTSREDRRLGDMRLSALGVVLMALGYIGLFFGRLIKAAVSRQRERLADASAVQFTRNPAGLAGALIRIRNGVGSHLRSFHAEDMSHMCFGETLALRWRRLFATHPTLDERLRALGPEWLARARVRARREMPAAVVSAAPAGQPAFVAPPQPVPRPALSPQTRPTPAPVRPGPADGATMGYAAALLAAIPDDLRQRARQPRGALLVVLALAVEAGGDAAGDVVAELSLDGVEREELKHLLQRVRQLGTRLRLPLVDLAMPALKGLSAEERRALRHDLHRLARADGRLNLFELLLTCLLDEHLAAHAGRATPVRFHRYEPVAEDLRVVLSLMVHASGAGGNAAQTLFTRFARGLLPVGTTLLPRARCTLATLQRSLKRLRDLSPLLKGPVIDALADLARADARVQVAEMELLRLVGELMDCPVPPLPAVVTRATARAAP